MNIDINQIETYTPTIYVNNSEPDLDETNLNHTEQALKRVTDAANAAILALKSLDSAKIDAAKIVNNLLATDASTVLSGPMGKALGDRLTAAENLLTQLNGDLKIKFLDVTCQEGKTETTALSAYDNIVTGMASLSNNNYIIGHILINDRLIITSTVAHTVRVYYINIPKK
jgi:hypothetical protein